jgi:hypothetical protein
LNEKFSSTGRRRAEPQKLRDDIGDQLKYWLEVGKKLDEFLLNFVRVVDVADGDRVFPEKP